MIDTAALAAEVRAESERLTALIRGRINAVPEQLRGLPVWGFYTADKSPRSAIPRVIFSPKNPATWATHATLQTAPIPGGAIGPTFMLTTASGLVVIDLDPPERAYSKERFPDLTDERRQLLITVANDCIRSILKWAIACDAWVERSSSGKGWHIFVFGTIPHHKYAIGPFGHILTTGNIHITGDVHPQSAATIPHAQAALDELISVLLQLEHIRPVSTAPVCIDLGNLRRLETSGRRLDLTDEQVIAKLNKLMKTVLEGGSASGNWSNDTFRLILDLDRITGDRQQLYDILMVSERLRTAGVTANGTDRYERTVIQFSTMLAKARIQNDQRFAQYLANVATYGGIVSNMKKEK